MEIEGQPLNANIAEVEPRQARQPLHEIPFTPRAKYEQVLKKLKAYTRGEAIEELSSETETEKVGLAVYGATGAGKSSIVNYLRRVSKDQNEYREDSPVSAAATQGAFVLMPFSLTDKINIFDTRGSNSLPNTVNNDAFVREIFYQIAAMRPLGYSRSHEDEQTDKNIDIRPFEVALNIQPTRIHIPIMCIPVTADRAHKTAINKVMLELRRKNVFPVVAITKVDMATRMNEFDGKSEKEIIATFAEQLGLSADDVVIFKVYRSRDEPRDFEEEAKAVENLHRILLKAERNMMYEPAIDPEPKEESDSEQEIESKIEQEQPSFLKKLVQYLFWMGVVFAVLLALFSKRD